MPTPSESTDALPLERERSVHTSCPPEDDRSGQWRVEVLDRLNRTALDTPLESGESLQPEEQSGKAESPGLLEPTAHRSEGNKADHGVSMDSAELTPSPAGASPSTSHVEYKEIDQTHPTAPTSSALDLPYSIRYGIESTRVRPMIIDHARICN